MYVCVCACMCVCMYASTSVCMHLCLYACLYLCLFVCLFQCMYACIYVYVCMHPCDVEKNPMRAMKADPKKTTMKAMRALKGLDKEPSWPMKGRNPSSMKAMKVMKAMKKAKVKSDRKAPLTVKERLQQQRGRPLTFRDLTTGSCMLDAMQNHDGAEEGDEEEPRSQPDPVEATDDEQEHNTWGAGAVKRPAAAVSKTTELEASGRRSTTKTTPFKKLKAAGKLPAVVTDLISNRAKGSPRDTETWIINNCMKKNDKGQYELCLEHPELKEMVSPWETTKKHKHVITKPTIMAHHMWGGEEKFLEAIHKKQAWYKPGSNQMEAEWYEGDVDKEEGRTSGWSTEAHKALGDMTRYSSTKQMLDGMGFSADSELTVPMSSLTGAASSEQAAPTTLLAIADDQTLTQGIPFKIHNIAQVAMQMSTKLIKESEKIANNLAEYGALPERAQMAIDTLYQKIDDCHAAERKVASAIRTKRMDNKPLTVGMMNDLISTLGGTSEALSEAKAAGKYHVSDAEKSGLEQCAVPYI